LLLWKATKSPSETGKTKAAGTKRCNSCWRWRYSLQCQTASPGKTLVNLKYCPKKKETNKTKSKQRKMARTLLSFHGRNDLQKRRLVYADIPDLQSFIGVKSSKAIGVLRRQIQFYVELALIWRFFWTLAM
jgi:hypothetical protein